MRIAIGIGPSRSSNQTRWLKFANQTVGDTTVQWTTDKNIVDVMVKNAPTLCVIKYVHVAPLTWMNWLNAIPVPSDLSGRVFVEFYGSPDVDYQRIGIRGVSQKLSEYRPAEQTARSFFYGSYSRPPRIFVI